MKIINKKKLMKEKIGKIMNAYDLINQELKVLQTLKHPNIIWLNEVIDDPNNDYIYLITDFYSEGSLGERLRQINE